MKSKKFKPGDPVVIVATQEKLQKLNLAKVFKTGNVTIVCGPDVNRNGIFLKNSWSVDYDDIDHLENHYFPKIKEKEVPKKWQRHIQVMEPGYIDDKTINKVFLGHIKNQNEYIIELLEKLTTEKDDISLPKITQTEVEIKSGHFAGYGVDKFSIYDRSIDCVRYDNGLAFNWNDKDEKWTLRYKNHLPHEQEDLKHLFE